MKKFGKRVQKLLTRLKHGEVLCKQHDAEGVRYFFEPSGKTVGWWTAEKAIASGQLKPNCDGLLENDHQSWSTS